MAMRRGAMRSRATRRGSTRGGSMRHGLFGFGDLSRPITGPVTGPVTELDLDPAERFVAENLRRWLIGLHGPAAGDWCAVWNAFARRFGAEDGRRAISGLAGLVASLARQARHPIRHRCRFCPSLSADEIGVLAFIGACQRREWGLARAAAEWLVAADGVGDMILAGSRLAAVLTAHGVQFPARCAPRPTTRESGASAGAFAPAADVPSTGRLPAQRLTKK